MVCSCIINIAKMQSDVEYTRVLKDFAFVALVGIAYHLSSPRLNKNIQELVSKTSQNYTKTLFDISCVLEALP